MPEFCTCGAQLPPDALFCHKCGKPQREIIAPETEQNTYPSTVAEVPPPPPTKPQPVPVNLRNVVAVRISFVTAISATLLFLLLRNLSVSWLAAGFFAVFFYVRKTGFRVDVGSGVKLGWITGLIAYGFAAIVLTAQLLPEALSGHLGQTMMDQMKNSSWQDPATLQQMAKLIQTQPYVWMLMMLGALFVLVTCLSMAGGALAAKLLDSPK